MASIADLQADRERLRAANAKEDFDAAMAATVSAAEVMAAGAALRRMLLDALAAVSDRFVSAIAGEKDETRAHFLLSEEAYHWLTALGESAQAVSAPQPIIGERFRRGVKPRDLLTVSRWADLHREINVGTNMPGQWVTDRTPYLREVMDSLSEHSDVSEVIFVKAVQIGAPLALDTPVPTPGGWSSMGELRSGDRVFGADGRLARVVGISEVFHDRDCYEVLFSDGARIVADAGHKWTVDDKFPGHAGKRRGARRLPVTRTTLELSVGLTNARGDRRYSIPLCGALDLPDAELPIPPYVLGYWIANGNLSGNQATCHEDDADELARHLTESGWAAKARKLDSDKGRACNLILETIKTRDGVCRRGHVLAETGSFITTAGGIRCSECNRQQAMGHKYATPVDPVVRSGFLTEIKALGMASKHIPTVYLRASRAQRLDLLRGLMDGDGSICAEKGRCEYSTVSERLADEMLDLLRGLGMKPVRYRVPRRGYAARIAEIEGGEHHRISFLAYADTPVFKLARKLSRQRYRDGGRPTQSGRRWIVAITPVPSVPVRCIAVDTADHLFLAGREMIATHNTEVMYNWIGYVMHHLGNKDMLVVVPTKEFRNQKFNPRLGRVLRDSPVLKKLASFASRSNKNTEDVLEYGAGAKIVKAGANVGTDLSSDSIAYVACDEVDKFPTEIPGFGDPMALIRGRQTTHTRAKAFKVSSPLLEETSRIWGEWLTTDMRRYHVPCPHCGELQHLEWGGGDEVPHGLKYAKALRRAGEEGQERAGRAWYVCKANGCVIEEVEKTAMLERGRWIAERPYVKGRRGYHLNALYAPPGLGLSWLKLADEHLAALGDSAAMQTFKNERLGLPWKEVYDATDPDAIIARLEPYTLETLPPWLVRAVGIDIQKDVIEVTLYLYGLDEECWGVAHYIVPGQTITAAPWQALGELLAELRPDCGGIDSGFNAEMVYAFAKGRRWLHVLKGMARLSTNTLIEDDGKRRQRLRGKRKTGMSPHLVSNLVGMQEITERLNMPVPEAGKPCGKFIHYPAGEESFDPGFFKQLTSNRKKFKKVRHRVVVEWEEGTPNEAYDCWKYSLAGFRLSKIDPAARMRGYQRRAGVGEAATIVTAVAMQRGAVASDRGNKAEKNASHGRRRVVSQGVHR